MNQNDHITCGEIPRAYVFSCTRCGAAVALVKPVGIMKFCAESQLFVEEHQACAPKEAEAHSEILKS